jgi:poly-gamma-glutamate synthesis protein (capsule biosynthesis protein)
MKIIISGDIALCRSVEQKILKGQGYQIAQGCRELLNNADLFLANIECPLTDSNTPQWNYFLTLKGSRQAGKLLGELGVDIASLANNHIADYGLRGLKDTISVLEEQKINFVGAGYTPDEARAPLIFERSGCKIGILALAQPEISAAKNGSWGAGVLEDNYAIVKMKELASSVDVAIAYLHFGVEFFEHPTPHQVRLCRALIDAGARMVVGHHPHVSQGYEYYKDGFIAYSLGNFIFDMPGDSRKFSGMGLLVNADIDKKGVHKLDIIKFDSKNGNPSIYTGKELDDAERHLAKLSSVLKDRNALMKSYYFTCKNNLLTHLRAFIQYSIKKRNPRRIKTLILSQFWPQILELRIDLFRFFLSGKAAKYEIMKRRRLE